MKQHETTSAIQGTHLRPKSAMLNRPFETSRWRHCPYRSYSAVHTAHCMFGVRNTSIIINTQQGLHFDISLPWEDSSAFQSEPHGPFPRFQRKLRFQSADDLIPTQAPIPVHVTNTEPGFGVLARKTNPPNTMLKQASRS